MISSFMAFAALFVAVAPTASTASPQQPPPAEVTQRLTADVTMGHRDAPLGHLGVSLKLRAARHLDVVGGVGYVLPEGGEYGRRGYATFAVGLRAPLLVSEGLELSLGTGLSRHDTDLNETTAVPGLGINANHRWHWQNAYRADLDLGLSLLYRWGFLRLSTGLGAVFSDPSTCYFTAGQAGGECSSAPSPSYLREPGLALAPYLTLSFGFNLIKTPARK